MAYMTRRNAIRAGGASMMGVAAVLLGSCSSQSSEGSSSQGSATEKGAAAALALNKDGLVDRSCFVGVNDEVELANGDKAVAINFDNGATTPSLTTVLAAVEEALHMYGSIGRGKGQKSSLSTQRFNAARDVVLRFFGANNGKYTCCFSGTATDALNKIAGALATSPDDVVLTTRSEHHANDLPWRSRATMRYVEVDELGRLRMDDFSEQLADGLRVADRRREPYATRVASRHARKALEQAERLPPAISAQKGVDLVDDHESQVTKETGNRRMTMQHLSGWY